MHADTLGKKIRFKFSSYSSAFLKDPLLLLDSDLSWQHTPDLHLQCLLHICSSFLFLWKRKYILLLSLSTTTLIYPERTWILFYELLSLQAKDFVSFHVNGTWGSIAQTVTLSVIWYHSRRCLKSTRNLINYLLYVANTGFPAKSKQKDVKITAEEISVWNPTITFHQSPSVLSALRTTVGKVNTCKQKENLWKIVVKGHEFFICIFKWQKWHRITSVFQIF